MFCGLFFVELAFNEVFEACDCLIGVVAFGDDVELCALGCGEHHEMHDGLAIDFLAVFDDFDVAAIAGGRIDERHRGTCVHPERVRDCNGRFGHERLHQV